ncbi:unnamed protein product [Soboliphyme baturini]|uniref:DUF5872 domain-containing protein n=1 Tax=Soboliphyme baturini TaxID=241478 RepID=A0A183IQ48_9BILA|nr:unnamed protein product [Soboliphyme baturini]
MANRLSHYDAILNTADPYNDFNRPKTAADKKKDWIGKRNTWIEAATGGPLPKPRVFLQHHRLVCTAHV